MKTLAKLLAIILIAFSLFISCAAVRTCPTQQTGTVSGTISETGETIIHIAYPCAYQYVPYLLVSPNTQGTLAVTRFGGNSLTGSDGSIAVFGEPGATVEFTWTAIKK